MKTPSLTLWPLVKGYAFKRDVCIMVFAQAAETLGLEVQPNQTVLEVGSAEADWLGLAARHQPEATFLGVDVRPYKGDGVAIQGDIFEQEFGDASLDGVVMVSALEHIGLGHYGDPVRPGGDIELMTLIKRWLKPGGWVYADVPWNHDRSWTEGTSHRVYDDFGLDRLRHGMTLEGRAFFSTKAQPLSNQAATEITGGTDKWLYCANLWRKP